MSTRGRLTRAIAAAAAIAILAVGAGGADADTTPTYHPAGLLLDTTAYSMRFAGATRYATAGSVAMFSAVSGEQGQLPLPLPIPGFEAVRTGFPFNDPDDSDSTSSFGNGACPTAVGLAAADTPADVLASSAAWNGTLTGTAVTSGGPTSVDIGPGVMLLTDANRTGANPALPTPTLAALQAIQAECGAFDAVVFGGTSAVGSNAANTLDSIAGDVIRVAGADRFATARLIAEAVDTAPASDHPTAAGGAVALGETVILAEAFTGADALAIGPFSAGNGIPVLLTPTGSLPTETTNGLLALNPDTIIVLGGTGAISDPVAAAAATAGSATVLRIAGADRYQTSVKIAERLSDVYGADAGGAVHSNLLIGVARSEGTGAAHAGWPDALSSAWMLATWWNAGDGTHTPNRLAPPVEQNVGDTFIGDAAIKLPPLLLTQATSTPASVGSFLSSLYPSPASIVTPATPAAVNDGGFAFVFGGTSAVSSLGELDIARRLSGGTYVSAHLSDIFPSQDDIFTTAIDFTEETSENDGGVDDDSNTAGRKACAFRGDLFGVQFLAVRSPAGIYRRAVQVDYQDDNLGLTSRQSRFMCVDIAKLDSEPAAASTVASVFSVSLSGHRTPATALDWSPGNLLNSQFAGPIVANTAGTFPAANLASGSASATYTYEDVLIPTSHRATAYAATTADISLTVTRTDGPGPEGSDDRLTVTGTIAVSNAGTAIWSGTFTGEGLADPSTPETFIGKYQTSTGGRGGFVMGVQASGALQSVQFNGNA
jgi:hypothetical protein